MLHRLLLLAGAATASRPNSRARVAVLGRSREEWGVGLSAPCHSGRCRDTWSRRWSAQGRRRGRRPIAPAGRAPPVRGDGALLGGAAILAALHDRAASGMGAIIDQSLYDSSVSLLYTFLPAYFLTGETPGPMGNQHMILSSLV